MEISVESDAREFEQVADEFLSGCARQNIRSRTAEVEHRGHVLHLKTSSIHLEDEAEALRRGADMDRPGVRSVRLVAYDRARNVLITEHAEGESLLNVLWNNTSVLRPWRYRTIDHVAVAHNLGSWLLLFQGASRLSTNERTPAESRRVADYLIGSLRSKLARIEELGGGALSVTDVVALRTFVERTTNGIAWDALEMCRIHGDFCPANVLVSGAGVASILDFADTRLGFALEDVARMWCCYWELTQVDPLRRAFLGPALAALPVDAQTIGGEAFTLFRIWNAAAKLLEDASSPPELHWRTHWLIRRLARRHASWLRAVLSNKGVR